MLSYFVSKRFTVRQRPNQRVVRRYHVSGGQYLDMLAEIFNLDRNDREELYLITFGNHRQTEKHGLRLLVRFVTDIYGDVFLGINLSLRPVILKQLFHHLCSFARELLFQWVPDYLICCFK